MLHLFIYLFCAIYLFDELLEGNSGFFPLNVYFSNIFYNHNLTANNVTSGSLFLSYNESYKLLYELINLM
jgi:hypothetical protein